MGALRQTFIGRYGQIRKSAKLPWHWDRQGQHAVAGAIITAACAAASWLVDPFAWVFYLAFVYVFVQYEVTETGDINDWAWPDLFGWMIGSFPAAALVWVAALVLE